jgi:hypothetical protein
VIPNGDARPAAEPSESSFVRLAEAYRREGLLGDAIRICREGLTRFPASLHGRILLGQSLLEQGETPEALAEFDRVERESSGSPEILALLREARPSVAPQHAEADESAETPSLQLEGTPETGHDAAREPDVLFLDFPEYAGSRGMTTTNTPVDPLASSTLAALYADQGDPVRAESIRRQLEAGRPGGPPAEATPRTGGAPGTRYLDTLIRLRDVVQRLRSGHSRPVR